MMPSTSYACGKTAVEKKMTSKEETSDCSKKDCCKENSTSTKKHHGCTGKCNHTNCTTTSLQFSLLATNEFELESKLLDFSLEKPILHHDYSCISAGFTSIWSPPKIK